MADDALPTLLTLEQRSLTLNGLVICRARQFALNQVPKGVDKYIYWQDAMIFCKMQISYVLLFLEAVQNNGQQFILIIGTKSISTRRPTKFVKC